MATGYSEETEIVMVKAFYVILMKISTSKTVNVEDIEKDCKIVLIEFSIKLANGYVLASKSYLHKMKTILLEIHLLQ